MRKIEEDRYQMLLRIQNYCNENTLKWQTNVPFTASFGLLEDKIEEIEEQIQIVVIDHEGITEDKRASREALNALMIKVTAAIKGYSSVSGTRELFKKVDFSPSELIQASG